jgi:hypothetical protein
MSAIRTSVAIRFALMARFLREKRALLINRATGRVKRKPGQAEARRGRLLLRKQRVPLMTSLIGLAFWLLRASFAAVSPVTPRFGCF